MLDTTAINFGIEKLKAAAIALKPVINTSSEQFIRFMAYKVWVKEGLFLILFFVGYGVFQWGKNIKGDKPFGWDKHGYEGFEAQYLGGIALMVIFGLCFLCGVYDLIMSLIDPKMFVIDKFLNKE